MNESALALTNVTEWGDFIAYYQKLNELAHNVSWHKADTLLALSDKFGSQSLDKFAQEIGEPRSTVVSYVRVARAFPPDRRNMFVSFSAHLAASYVDPYNDQQKDFAGEQRFELLDKAIDEGLSARQVQEKVQEEKIARQERGEVIEECDACHSSRPTILTYRFSTSFKGRRFDEFKLHESCYEQLVSGLGGRYGR